MIILKSLTYSPDSRKKSFGEATDDSIIKNISINIELDRINGFVGKSGCGKTTLLKLLSNMLPPSGGELIYKNIKLDKREVQLLFQNSVNLVNPYRKANDILKEAHLLADQFISYNELLDLCNISTTMLAKRGIELSGGERQRVALARLVAVHPKLILLDEPFAAQDPAAKRVMKEMLLNIKNHHSISLICVSHDFQSLKGFTDYLYVMDEGKIIEEGSAEKIFTSPEHRITARLIKAEKYELTEEELLPPKEIRGN